MPETGIESRYVLKNGKRLRLGYTTGTCAAAAAKAAALLLFRGQADETVELVTPKGIALRLEVLDPRLERGRASCAVRKDAGDDPDATDGILVYAEVRALPDPEIEIDGGPGVGRVTKPGLKLPVGAAAINPAPREMIRRAAEEALAACGQSCGLSVLISVPGGAELAKKTFNPRLGIEGGISILGTSGIVEPMSEDAILESLELEIRQKRALGWERLILVPGNYGADYARSALGFSDGELVKCSNYIGCALDMAADAGFPEVLLIGHVGKLVKLSGGIMNTHSREGDARAELFAALALRAGGGAELARTILDCVTTDGMLEALRNAGLLERAMTLMAERIDLHLRSRVRDRLRVGAVVFSENYGELCRTGPAAEWLAEGKSEG
ncbi:MAG: cobalamin biosynthesis protein CbiD [Oscillospiraceae bacterium]|nr:cobalamin biosynthesis protein CbiD [Oscillospiraceae bacterium]